MKKASATRPDPPYAVTCPGERRRAIPASTQFTPDHADPAPGAQPGRRVRAIRLPASAGSPPGSVSKNGDRFIYSTKPLA